MLINFINLIFLKAGRKHHALILQYFKYLKSNKIYRVFMSKQFIKLNIYFKHFDYN